MELAAKRLLLDANLSLNGAEQRRQLAFVNPKVRLLHNSEKIQANRVYETGNREERLTIRAFA